MTSIQRKAAGFLKRYQMHPQDVDMDAVLAAFLIEMERGLTGRKSSLEMIPTYLEAETAPPPNQRVIVVDAGGTNFRVATVYFDEAQEPVIENRHLTHMPGTKQEIGKKEFFHTIAGHLKGVAKASDRIGFCFSYPAEVLPDKDARTIRFAKEVKAKEVVGELIGKNLNHALAEAYNAGGKHIVLLNDTVATLLAGVGFQNRSFSSFIGFILGTGINSAYIEKNVNIKKKSGLDPDRSQIINVESSGVRTGYLGKLDHRFDKTTHSPGQTFEKMVSGAYLGPLCLFVLKQACKDGLFTTSAAGAIAQLETLDTKEMNTFLLYPDGDNPLAKACTCGGGDDIRAAFAIADLLIERAAKLAAINLSAAALKTGCGTDPVRPICIVAEGTTFYKMRLLKSRVEYYLKHTLEKKKGIYTEIVQVDNATLVGAAIAGLTN